MRKTKKLQTISTSTQDFDNLLQKVKQANKCTKEIEEEVISCVINCNSTQVEDLVVYLLTRKEDIESIAWWALAAKISKKYWIELKKLNLSTKEQGLVLSTLRVYSINLLNSGQHSRALEQIEIAYQALINFVLPRNGQNNTVKSTSKTKFFAEYHFIKGSCLFGLQQYDEAMNNLSKAISFNKDKATEVYVQQLECCTAILEDKTESIKKLKVAKSDIDELVSKMKKTDLDKSLLWPTISINAAICYSCLKDYAAAITYAEAALRSAISENNAENLVKVSHILARAHINLDTPKPEESVKYVKFALSYSTKLKQPLSSDTLFSLYQIGAVSYLKFKESNYQEALSYTEQALKLNLSKTQQEMAQMIKVFITVRDSLNKQKWEDAIKLCQPILLFKTDEINTFLPVIRYYMAVSFLALGKHAEALELALAAEPPRSDFHELKEMGITPAEIIIFSAYALGDYKKILEHIPKKLSTPNAESLLFAILHAAEKLKDKTAIKKISHLINDTINDESEHVANYKELKNFLLAIEFNSNIQDETLLITSTPLPKSDVSSDSNSSVNIKDTEEKKNKKETIKEKVDAKLNKIVYTNKLSFFPEVLKSQKIEKEQTKELELKIELIPLKASFLSTKKSNIFCTLESSSDIKKLKDEYPEAYGKLTKALKEGVICAKKGQQGLKYLTDSFTHDGKKYHWEVKILGDQGDHRLFGYKAVSPEGKTVIVFDKAGNHQELIQLQKHSL